MFDLTGKKLKAVDLFSGAGGFTLGFAMSGIDVVGHVEIEESAENTYHANAGPSGFGNSELIGRDITKITDDEILAFKERHGKINVVFGSPPCGSFSWAGKRELGDPRDNLFLHFVRFVKLLEPDIFVLENVPGLLSKKTPEGDLVVDNLLSSFEDVGYSVDHALLNAVAYGVPQSRLRLFVFGTSGGRPYRFPLPLYGLSKEGSRKWAHGNLPPGRRCSVCGKYFTAWTFDKNGEKVCLFCDRHRKDMEEYGPVEDLELEENYIVTFKDESVPALASRMFMIHDIRTRTSLLGTSRFLFVRDGEENKRWLAEREVRRIADDDVECDRAYKFVDYRTLKGIFRRIRGKTDKKNVDVMVTELGEDERTKLTVYKVPVDAL